MSYKEEESVSEEESEATEAEDGYTAKVKEEDENTQTIEKIIDHRLGKKGGGYLAFTVCVRSHFIPHENHVSIIFSFLLGARK